jgi:hypothetical protein
MQPHERDEIAQAILAGDFIPLRLVDGKLLPPPSLTNGVPAGITPEQARAAYERARQLTPEERRAERARVRARYAQVLSKPSITQ